MEKENGLSKRQKRLAAIMACVAAVVALLVVISFRTETGPSAVYDDHISVNLYFLEANSLKQEERVIPAGSNTEIVQNVLGELLAGPKTATYTNPVPEGILLSAEISGDNVNINFSRDYANIKGKEEVLCRASLVWTLTDLDYISSVQFFIEEDEILKANGQPIGKLTREDIVIPEDDEPYIDPKNQETLQTITLYFSNEQATGLEAEEREISVSSDESLERHIVEQLILGPQREDLYETVPPETKILDIQTTVDGICYVDLSSEFSTKNNVGSTGERLTIYSIVNSLTELNHVKKVQFFIEGEKQEEYKGHIEKFSQPFERAEF